MDRRTDQELLRDYCVRRSEPAFTELARRHVDLVYSAALRMLRDVHLAEDVTQGTFAALARGATQLAEHPVLSGWLHRTARNLAANIIRTDSRRRAREQEAVTMNQLLTDKPDDVWEHVAPMLDDALGELDAPDHDALFLRYFEKKSAREIAQRLGISDEAAQKRVSRATDRLRELFAKRGVTVGAGGLGIALTANAVQAAPAGLAAAVATTALAGTVVTTATTTTLATTTKVIAMTTLQKTIIAAAIAASVATPLVIQHQNLTRLRDENAALHQQTDQLAGLRAENERLSNLLAQINATPALSDSQQQELVRLRGEVTRLRDMTNAVGQLQAENRKLEARQPKPDSSSAPDVPPQNIYSRASWKNAGLGDARSAFQTAVWALANGDGQTYAACLSPEMLKVKQKEVADRMQLTGKSEQDLATDEIKELAPMTGYRVLDEKNVSNVSDDQVILDVWLDGIGALKSIRMMKIGDEWKMDAAP